MSGQRVSVVVPVWASAATLKPLVERLTAVLAPRTFGHEIILVNDGSSDQRPILRRPGPSTTRESPGTRT